MISSSHITLILETSDGVVIEERHLLVLPQYPMSVGDHICFSSDCGADGIQDPNGKEERIAGRVIRIHHDFHEELLKDHYLQITNIHIVKEN